MILAIIFLSSQLLNSYFSRGEAIIAILLFLCYNLYLFIDAKKNPIRNEEALYVSAEMQVNMGIHSSEEMNVNTQTGIGRWRGARLEENIE